MTRRPTTVKIQLRLSPRQIATLRALLIGTSMSTEDRSVGAVCISVRHQLDRQREVWAPVRSPEPAASSDDAGCAIAQVKPARRASAARRGSPTRPSLDWDEHGHNAIGDDGTKYKMQIERVRGEPPYYTVWLRPPGATLYQTELTNERSMQCTPARARRIAELHAAGVSPEAGGYSVSPMRR